MDIMIYNCCNPAGIMVRNYSIDVNIAKDPAIFLPGESVTGNMVVNVGSAMKVRGIRIRILGQINTCIRIRKYGENNISITDEITPAGYYEVHRETDTYIDQQVTVWGNG